MCIPKIPFTIALLLGLPGLSAERASAQEEARPLDHGYTMLMKGTELEGQDKNAEAVALYATVHRSDTVAERVLLRRVVDLMGLERYAEVLPLCDEGAAMDGAYTVHFIDNKASSLFNLERYDEAIAVCDAAIRTYPGYFEPRNLRAKALLKKKDLPAALIAMEDNVRYFPLQQEAHMNLAVIAQQEGRTSQSALALFAALIMRWGDTRSNQLLAYADELLDGKLDKDPKGIDLTKGDDFSEMDLLLANRVGMSKGYKVKPDMPYAFVRQGHLLLSGLKDHSAGDGFWTAYYVPFFKRLMDAGLFEPFMYHCLSNSNDAKITAVAARKKKDVDAFRKGLLPLITGTWATFPDSIGGTYRPVRHHYNDDGDLFAIGDGDLDANTQTGPWVLFHTNGRVAARMTFNADHMKEGEAWSYYDNGRPTRTQHWSNGVENGTFQSWYRNGAPKDSAGVVNGKGQGPYAQHTETGALRTRKTLLDGEITGPATVFLPCGEPEAKMDLVKDQMNSPGEWHYADGRVRFTSTFKDGLRQGTSVEYYLNGNKQSSYSFVDDKRDGPYTEWYPDGQKQAEGAYKADKATGASKAWYATGVLSTDMTYDDQGREQGVRKDYTPEGQLQTEMEYNRGLLVRYRYYDRKGNVIGEGRRSKGRFQFEGFTPDGAKRMKGSYLDEGAKDGAWTWWYPDGTVSLEENLKDGKLDGTQHDYGPNGKLKTEYRYLPGKGSTGPFTTYALDGSIAIQGWLEDGDLNGERTHYLPDGKVMEHERYVKGELDGWQSYYDRDGVLEREERIENSVPREIVLYGTDGKEYQRLEIGPGACTVERKYPGGQPYSVMHFMNGKVHGPAVWYYPDGSKEVEATYVEGERNGTWKSWHPNGKPSYEATYDMGQLNGTTHTWDINGTLTEEEIYVNGRSAGEKTWHANGKPAIDRPKRFGMINGTVKSYNATGDLQLVRYYRDDRLVGYSYNGTDGKLVDTIFVDEGRVQMRPYYANGKPSREMDLRNDEIDGTYREFNSDGSLLEEANYVTGERNGTAREFHANGKLAVTCEWLNDGRNGEELKYWDNGQLQEKSTWVHGQLHGQRTLYDRTGKPTFLLTYRNGDVVEMHKP